MAKRERVACWPDHIMALIVACEREHWRPRQIVLGADVRLSREAKLLLKEHKIRGRRV